MATMPLPDFPPLADDALQEPTTRRNPLGFILPLLAGGLALRGGGGDGFGGLLEGVARGLQVGSVLQERQETKRANQALVAERQAERKALAEERKADLLRDLHLRAEAELGKITDPAEHAERRHFWASVYRGAGGNPDEIEGITLSPTRVNRARQAEIVAAADRVATAHEKELADPAQREQVLNFTVRLPSGGAMTVRDLLLQSGRVRATVEHPIVEERAAPEVTGTGPGLTQAGLPQRIITGRETREELYFRDQPTEPTVTIPIPGKAPINVPLSMARQIIGPEGVKDLLGITSAKDRQSAEREAQQRVLELRTKDLDRLKNLETSMRQATSEAQVRGAVQAANVLISNIKANTFKRTLMPEVAARPLFVEQEEVLAWRQRQRAAREGAAGPRVAPGGLTGLLVLRSQGLATGNPYIDRLSPQQADALSRDPRLKQQNILDLILGAGGEAGTVLPPKAPVSPGAQPSAMPGTPPPAAAAPQAGAPSRDAQDTVAHYRRTKQPIPQALWRTFSPQEQAWLRRQGVKVAPQ